MTYEQYAPAPFTSTVTDRTSGNVKIKKGDYLPEGTLPIIDQGQALIGGYTNDTKSECHAQLPCIVFGDHTKCFKYIDFPFALGADGVKVLEVKHTFYAKYLYYCLLNVKLPNNLGYSRHFKYLKQSSIPYRELKDQKRIAAILDKADAIRRKRQQAIAMADTFLRSVFLDMFGDPVTNPKGWDSVDLGEIANDVRYGTSVKCFDEPSDDMLPVLRIPNINHGIIDYCDLKYAHLNNKERKRLRLYTNDLLFVRTNGNPDYIARCAVYEGEAHTLFASYLIRVRLESKKAHLSKFIRDMLSLPAYRSKITKETKTTAGNYNINSQGLKGLKIILPNDELVNRYLSIAHKIKTTNKKLQANSMQADITIKALSQKAFRSAL